MELCDKRVRSLDSLFPLENAHFWGNFSHTALMPFNLTLVFKLIVDFSLHCIELILSLDGLNICFASLIVHKRSYQSWKYQVA